MVETVVITMAVQKMKNEPLSFSSQPRFLNIAALLQKSIRLWKLNLNVKNKTKKLKILKVRR